MPDLSDLPVVDGLTLPADRKQLLKPGEFLTDGAGKKHRLPRYFYEVESWQIAKETELAPCFGLYEFINTDVREAARLREWPRYIPCTVSVLAAALYAIRDRVGTYVHIACNGGYRSPGHYLSRDASLHHWGTAVNIYRIGDDYLDHRDRIARYAEIVRDVLPGAWIRPYGPGVGQADDHLHLDLGYLTFHPRDADEASG